MSDRHIVVNLDGYNALVSERDRLAAELAEAQSSRDEFALKLAASQHSLYEWRKIAENRRVDGRKAWDEVDRLKARIDEMFDAQKWEVPK